MKKRFEIFNLVCMFDMPYKCEMHLENVLPTIWVYFLYVTCFETIFLDIGKKVKKYEEISMFKMAEGKQATFFPSWLRV